MYKRKFSSHHTNSRPVKALTGQLAEMHDLKFAVGLNNRYTGWPKKVSHYQLVKKIVLKPVNEIRFIRRIKV